MCVLCALGAGGVPEVDPELSVNVPDEIGSKATVGSQEDTCVTGRGRNETLAGCPLAACWRLMSTPPPSWEKTVGLLLVTR